MLAHHPLGRECRKRLTALRRLSASAVELNSPPTPFPGASGTRPGSSMLYVVPKGCSTLSLSPGCLGGYPNAPYAGQRDRMQVARGRRCRLLERFRGSSCAPVLAICSTEPPLGSQKKSRPESACLVRRRGSTAPLFWAARGRERRQRGPANRRKCRRYRERNWDHWRTLSWPSFRSCSGHRERHA